VELALQAMSGVLHVRIVAPMPARLLALQKRLAVDLETAHGLATRHDKKTAGYLSQVFGIDVDDPMLYHLVINTGKLGVDHATELIAATVRQLEAASAA
jgi:cytidylate kinase